MGSTSRFGLSYPELTDAPNGPAQLQELASDVDGWLCRAFPCTSSTLPTGVSEGFFARETDTGNVKVWTGSAWAQVTGTVTGGGGGGGGTTTSLISTISATYAATATQSIPTGADTVVAFGVEQSADPAVTRSTSGAGHKFTLAQTRLWVITATLRFAQNAVGGRRFDLVNASSGAVLASASGPVNTDAPWTVTLSVARKLTAGTAVQAIARHNSSGAVSLEPSSGNYVHIDIAGV